MGSDLVAGVDLGGTSLLCVVADAQGKVRGEAAVETIRGKGADAVIDQVVQVLEASAKAAGVKVFDLGGLGVGPAGAVEPGTGVVRVAPNLGWKDVPLANLLRKRTGLSTVVDNDVHVAMLGEHAYGAAKGARSAVAIWVGTGIGGAIILDDELWLGNRGSAGEVGHTVLVNDGPKCGCGRRGCAEALASRTSMERDVRAQIKKGRKSVVLEIMKKKNKDRMTSSVVERALDKGDKVMHKVFHAAQDHVGDLAGNLINSLDPEVVVIGGGLAERFGERFVERIRVRAYSRLLNTANLNKVRIVSSALGSYSGALGACVLSRKHLAAGTGAGVRAVGVRRGADAP
ncbi:MAG: ROK family protein [Deltaproteobacteria bacterium]|nr:ROK family protein [Deltaproteobacteria bacterium]